MMRVVRLFIVITSIFIASLFITACENIKEIEIIFGEKTTEAVSDKYVLPDLTGKTVFNYFETIDIDKVTISVKKENHSSIPANEFIRYGESFAKDSEVEVGTVIEVYFSLGPVPVNDKEKPVINGVEDTEVRWSSTFDVLQGVSVIDNVDGDLTYRLKVTGDTVDTSKLQTYEVTYTVSDKSGNITQVTRKITVIPIEIDTRYTDSLTLDRPYEGKSFLTDGIGKVTLSSCIDGDTARFNELDDSVRFLGIDTPESTPAGGYDPWGDEAKQFTCNILKNATTIVLESEGSIRENYGRYIAFVWVDGRLLNLEIVEEAYSTAKISGDSKYFQIFVDAEYKTQFTKRRIWGELDPNFNYK